MTDYSQIIELVKVGIVVLIGGGLVFVLLPLLISRQDTYDINIKHSRHDKIVSTPSARHKSKEHPQAEKTAQGELDRFKVIKLAGDNPIKTTMQIRNWLHEKESFSSRR